MAKKKKENFPRRKRRTDSEISIEVQKKRSRLYKVRSDVKKELSSVGLSEKRKGVLERRLGRSNDKITSINVRLVKTSVRGENFKKNKRKIRAKINSIKRDIKKGEFTDKELYNKLHIIREYSMMIESLEGKLYEKYIDEAILPKSQKQTISKDGGNIVEQHIVVWEVKPKVLDGISSKLFDTLSIEGDVVSVIDLGSVIMDIDVFLANITDKQHLTATPMVLMVFDFPKREIQLYNNTGTL